MTTPEQARELMQRLRLGASIAKERDLYSGYIPVALASADCIESLLAEIERLTQERDAFKVEAAEERFMRRGSK